MFEEQPSFIKRVLALKRVITPVAIVELAIGISGIALSCFGFVFYFQAANQAVSCTVPQEPTKEFTQSLVVSIAGAVKEPGLVVIQPGSRLGQAIEQVGGFQEDADTAYISKQLNLAAVVTDQQQIYIPFADEQKTNQQSLSESDQLVSTTTNSAPGLLSINTATATELETLPGIGSKRAEDIIQNRPFQNMNELVDKKILSTSLFDQIKSLVTL